jgi:hypothetical protein
MQLLGAFFFKQTSLLFVKNKFKSTTTRKADGLIRPLKGGRFKGTSVLLVLSSGNHRQRRWFSRRQ